MSIAALQGVLITLTLLVNQLTAIVEQLETVMVSEPPEAEIASYEPVLAENHPIIEVSPIEVEEIEVSEIRAIIIEEAIAYGVGVDLSLFTAKKESQFNPTVCNPSPSSSACGLYQFLDGTWEDNCEGERSDPRDNTVCFMELVSAGHIHHWTADEKMRNWLLEAGFVFCTNPDGNVCFLASN